MKLYRFPLITVFLVAVLIFAAFTLAPSTRAQGLSVQGQLSPQANAGTAFTYQGRIIFNGTPVNNEICSVLPTLWDAQSGGTQVASASQTVVNPSNGYFKMDIDFGSSAFTGAERWLQLKVACVSDPNAAQGTILPRVRLAPTPYALSLVPGAYVQDDSASPGTAFSATSGQTWYLPLFIATKIAGIWGNSQLNDGVIGTSQQGNGVYGYSETGKAVYADGDAHVEGNLTWKAKRSVISIPTSAFIPEQLNDAGHVPYDNEGYYLKNESNQDEWFTAPVQLPQGAVVKQLNVGWRDGSDFNASLMLRRRSLSDFTGTFQSMAQVDSVGSLHTIKQGLWSDDTIDYATIDNEHYTYYLELAMRPANEDIRLYGVNIVYEITQPY
ncbi:MAG: hypothetical protein GXP38_09740 [Chloroflexi bacterium]|nr:hypothetical protein [Chloroflexota bacterium]